MNRKIKIAYLLMLGKKPVANTVKDFTPTEYGKIFKFLNDMDVGKIMPWFAEKPK
jgi:hypothetical protein